MKSYVGLALFSIAVFSMSCGGPKMAGKSPCQYRPSSRYEWYRRNKPPKDKEYVYFIGRYDNAVRESDAFRGARSDAYDQVAMFVRTRVLYVFQRAHSEHGLPMSMEEIGHVVNSVSNNVAQASLKNVEEVESQLKTCYNEGPGGATYYNVATLMRVPKSALKEMLAQSFRESLGKVKFKNQREAEILLDTYDPVLMGLIERPLP